MRDAFSSELIKLASKNPKLLLLTGDHGYGLFDGLRREHKKQYLNMGVAEQNMVGVASGLSRSGFRPLVYGLSSFIPVRVLEQIKIDVCHDNLPVIFLGDGAGFVYSHLGTSHQSTEDIAVTRAIPNLIIFSPADRFEMVSCLNLAYESQLPVYIRIGKSDIGQSLIIQNQLVLGVESIEGTDELIKRTYSYKKKGDKGILLKLSKYWQHTELDLPTIGLETLMQIKKYDYEGLYIEKNICIILDKAKVINFCNENNLFLSTVEKID